MTTRKPLNSYLGRGTFWCLEIHYYQRAVDAGLRPNSNFSYADADDESYYRPTKLYFTFPPRRQDFIAVYKRTPWMSPWAITVMPLIERNDWPMIDAAHKASHVDLIREEDNKKVGELEVRKYDVYKNIFTPVPIILSSVTDTVVNRLKKDVRHEAYHLISQRENYIQERCVEEDEYSDEFIAYQARVLLHEAGYMKAKPKPPKK